MISTLTALDNKVENWITSQGWHKAIRQHINNFFSDVTCFELTWWYLGGLWAIGAITTLVVAAVLG